MATGRVRAVVHCQSPSGDGSYRCIFRNHGIVIHLSENNFINK